LKANKSLQKSIYESTNNPIIKIFVFAIASYVPMLLTKPGVIAADTKAYLYINPVSMTKSALYIWSPTESLGTVTHQNIGYLLPMGPFYSIVINLLHVQPWIAQRLWTGSCMFFAGYGIAYLFKTLNFSIFSQLTGGFIYMLAPYSLQYYEYLSALLLPYVALGWILAFTIKAAQTNDWLYVCCFGLALTLTSSINATAVVYLGLAPVIWLIYATARKYISALAALRTAIKLGVVSLLTSLWWISGLFVEDKWGINILKFTETVQAVASTSTPLEVIRGLGYWYFYVIEASGLVMRESIGYQTWIWLIVVSFLIPFLSVTLSFIFNWKDKLFFVILIITGLTLSVGAHPFNNPTPFGKLFKEFMLSSTAGEALRSTDRATPLVILGLAALASGFIEAVLKKLTIVGVLCSLTLIALSLINDPSLFNGGYVDPPQSRTTIPNYTYQAANYLTHTNSQKRALLEPGQDFADYTYGYTNDPVMMGLTNKPIAQRVQVPYGTYPSVNLLEAFDLAVQNNYLDPSTIAPIARLLSAGDFILESDYNWELYEQPDPQYLLQSLTPTPNGLKPPVVFGQAKPNPPPKDLPSANEQILYFSENPNWPYPIMIYPVTNSPPIIHAESVNNSVVIDGGGSGIVNSAAAGLLNQNPTVFYAGTLETLPGGLSKNLPPDSTLIVTDTNRREARIWTTLRDPIGETLYPWQKQDNSVQGSSVINLFDKLGPNSQSTAISLGARYVIASSYGSSVAFTPEVAPPNAFDANLKTSWLTAGFSNPINQWIKIGLVKPVVANKITLYQAQVPLADRVISKVRITINGNYKQDVYLTNQSLTNQGQTIEIGNHVIDTIKITITQIKNLYYKPGVSPVGFSEIGIPFSGSNYPHLIQAVKLPTDLLNALGASSINHRLIYIFSRQRVGPFPPRTSPELSINRIFYLPTQRGFGISGMLHISALISDQEIDTLTGRYPPGSYPGSFPVARSEGRLIGDLNALADSAFENNSNYVWQPEIGADSQKNSWIELDLPKPTTINTLTVSVLNDKNHSLPTQILLSTEQGVRILNLKKLKPEPKIGSKAVFHFNFQPLTGRDFRLTITKYEPRYTTFYATTKKVVLPVAIAHVSINGISVNNLPKNMPSVCQNNLISLMGPNGNVIPIWVKILGTTQNAMEGKELRFVGCGPDKNGLILKPGNYFLTTGDYQSTGFDIDQINLDSLPGGKANLSVDGFSSPIVSGAPTVSIKSTEINPTKYQIKVTQATKPFWLVFGQSFDTGWRATLNGKALGAPTLIDGYANGWLISPKQASFEITISFYPQQYVNLALIISFLTVLACLLGLLRPFKRIKHMFKGTKMPKLTKKLQIETPVIGNSHSVKKPQVPFYTVILWSVFIAGLFYFVANIQAALTVGVATLLLTYKPNLKYLAGLVSLILGAYLITYVALEQSTHHYQPGPAWTSYFDSRSYLVWVVIALLLAQSVAQAIKFKSFTHSGSENI